jgi:phospholipid/cholesterol/gamma-HCH transport system permease protein
MTMQAHIEELHADDLLEEAAVQKPGSSLLDGPRELGRDLRNLYRMLRQVLSLCFRGKYDRKMVFEQCYVIGNESVLFVTVVLSVVGMIMVVQAGLQTQKVLPELSLLGANLIQMLMREFAPTVCALMLATRVGAGIAAEIGSMVVTEQVDALRMSAADPVEYLVVPRFVASIVMTTALVFWTLALSIVAGTFTAGAQFDLTANTFINFSLLNVGDFIVCLMKAVAYGAAIPIVSSYRGLSTFGGSEGVGWATTSAVVHSSLAIIIIDFILSVFGYIVFPPA